MVAGDLSGLSIEADTGARQIVGAISSSDEIVLRRGGRSGSLGIGGVALGLVTAVVVAHGRHLVGWL
ncbi:hypothetical protein AYO39_01140 [Actinobacteria bacterium SCGC AG-212-D09]|nr:hypothetical protein AYO39_01140 [Actinobacteria bacterium SCGC AG-212-D09]